MDLVYLTLATFVAGLVGTVTGFGTSIIVVPVALLFLNFPQALLLAGIIHLFDDVWKLLLFRKGVRWRLILYFGIPGIFATLAGALLVFNIREDILMRIVGGFFAVYSLTIILNNFELKQKDSTAVVGGIASGFLAGLIGLGGVVRSVFLSAFNMKKAVYIATVGAIALFVDTTRLIAYVGGGVELDKKIIWGFLLFIPASFLGAEAAKYVLKYIPEKQFRSVVAVFLFLLGLKFLLIP
ncbi:MAG: sulfite exporter TauE/SafE family protein [Parcubacteria group bacterium]|nr:sulfite exporter TauE/SafE family protein [Parcubacteria group bacterium]